MSDHKENNATFIERVEADRDAINEAIAWAVDWLDIDATKAEAMEFTEVVQAHDARMKALETARTALPEALERLAETDEEAELVRGRFRSVCNDLHRCRHERDRLRVEVERLQEQLDEFENMTIVPTARLLDG